MVKFQVGDYVITNPKHKPNKEYGGMTLWGGMVFNKPKQITQIMRGHHTFIEVLGSGLTYTPEMLVPAYTHWSTIVSLTDDLDGPIMKREEEGRDMAVSNTKFNVGDVVKAVTENYVWTTEANEWQGVVTEVGEHMFSADTTYLIDERKNMIGHNFHSLRYENFELVAEEKQEIPKFNIGDIIVPMSDGTQYTHTNHARHWVGEVTKIEEQEGYFTAKTLSTTDDTRKTREWTGLRTDKFIVIKKSDGLVVVDGVTVKRRIAEAINAVVGDVVAEEWDALREDARIEQGK